MEEHLNCLGLKFWWLWVDFVFVSCRGLGRNLRILAVYCIHDIDYEKAFDSVEHEIIFKALRNIGINETYINIIEDIYTDATAKVHIEKQMSEEIRILRGVRQGDPISPKLFTASIEEVFKNCDLDKMGRDIDGEKLTDLRFADDTMLLSRRTP